MKQWCTIGAFSRDMSGLLYPPDHPTLTSVGNLGGLLKALSELACPALPSHFFATLSRDASGLWGPIIPPARCSRLTT